MRLATAGPASSAPRRRTELDAWSGQVDHVRQRSGARRQVRATPSSTCCRSAARLARALAGRGHPRCRTQATVQLVPEMRGRRWSCSGTRRWPRPRTRCPPCWPRRSGWWRARGWTRGSSTGARRGPAPCRRCRGERGGCFVELAGTRGRGGPAAAERAAGGGAGQRGCDAGEAAALWRIREDGAGLAARASGRPAYPGWEDAAVPPERLGAYLREFDELLPGTA